MKKFEAVSSELTIEKLFEAKKMLQDAEPCGSFVGFGKCPECEIVHGGEGGPKFCPKCKRNYYWRQEGDEKYVGPKYGS